MERMTYWFSHVTGGSWQLHGQDNLMCEETCREIGNCDICPVGKAIEQLAAYEDTGMTPEEVIEMKVRMEGLEK